MRKGRLVSAGTMVLFAATLSAAPALAAQRTETERVTRTVPLSPGGTLKVKNFSGRVTITGTNQPDVSIDAVRRGSRDRLDRIKLDIQSSGSIVTIEANKRDETLFGNLRNKNVVETDLDIKVPSRTNLDVSVFSADVTVSNVTGRHDVHGFSADLRLADISGPLRAHTFNGAVRVQLAPSEREPELDIDTFSGDIEVRVPEEAKAGVSFNSFSGDLRSDVPITVWRSGRRTMRGNLNGGNSHVVKLKTFSGDVRIVR